ncbi:MAG TPA: FAD-dependent oxidoreductase [Dehalococcoidia bacterium]|nr:FAD-dependent oxidoreductase [Dehalococcoidia bacterium]
MEFPLLFSPINVGAMSLKNRVVMSPMLTNYSDAQCGVTPRHVAYYRARALGGAGLIEIEGTAVHPVGRGFPLGLGCWEDAQVEGLAGLARAIHEGGAKAVLQLIHAGRQTVSKLAGAQPVAPSPIPCPRMREMPRELTREDIAELVEAFAQGARRARDAGFDGVELHGAHGYLINQFISPYSNVRTDEYGGDLQGRTRFAVDIIRRIHQVAGQDFPVLCRISADEFVEGGVTPKEAPDIARVLEDAGLAAIHVSAGVYGCVPPTAHPHGTPFGVFSHLAGAVKAAVHIPVVTVGRITRPYVAEDLLRTGVADLIAVGRAHIADPEWARKAQEGRPEDIILCVDCNACNQRAIRPDIVCLINPFTGREEELKSTPAAQPKKVAVVGGGLTGLLAARIAAERGHRVTLYDGGSEPGGLLALRGRVPHLSEWTEKMDYLVRQASLAGVEIRVGSEPTPEMVQAGGPDAVVVSMRGPALRPAIQGFAGDRVFSFDQAMSGEAGLGREVVVLGGGLMGTEAAYYLASQGKRVTIVEPGEALATDTHPSNRYYLLEWMKDVQMRILTGASVTGASGRSVTVSRLGQAETLEGIDSLVLAMGYGPAEGLAGFWKDVAPEVHFVDEPYEAHQGTEAAYKAARIALEI